jgi:hypothetical protein
LNPLLIRLMTLSRLKRARRRSFFSQRTGATQMARQPPRGPKPELSPADRIAAAVLAFIWATAGAAAMILGLARHYGFAAAVGVCAIGDGVLWALVARSGRRLRWPRRAG